MSFFKSIWADLVERRLLPVLIILVAALVAIPFVLSSNDASTSAPTGFAGPVSTTPTDSTGLGPKATTAPLSQLNVDSRHAKIGHRDPFTQPKAPKDKTKLQTRPGSATNGGGTTGGGTTTTTTPYTPPSPSTPTTPYTPPSPTPATPKPGGGSTTTTAASPKDYRVTLRVGQSGNLKVHDDVERLTPLPSTVDPFFVFMGVMSDGKTAVFLLSSDAKATGDGTCKPSPTNCQTVEMQAQDVEFFDVAGGDADGTGTQYELDLTRIIKTTSSPTAVKASAHTATASTGAGVVDQTRSSGASAISGYAFDPMSGTLHRSLPTLGDVLADIARGPVG